MYTLNILQFVNYASIKLKKRISKKMKKKDKIKDMEDDRRLF